MPALTLVARPDGVAVLTIDQPGSKANVLTAELWAEFEAMVESLSKRTDLRGLILASAKPGVFIAGADLKLLLNAPGPNDPAVRAFIDRGNRVLLALEALPFPTCAAIDGAALGGGLEVALACTFRVCGTNPKVQLGLPETKLGLIPGWGGTQRLPRIVGMQQAAEMLIRGNSLDHEAAKSSGIAFGPASSTDLIERGSQLLLLPKRPVFRSPEPIALPDAVLGRAAREAIRVMTTGAGLTLREGIALETEAFMNLAGSAESKQMIAEFFASRKA